MTSMFCNILWLEYKKHKNLCYQVVKSIVSSQTLKRPGIRDIFPLVSSEGEETMEYFKDKKKQCSRYSSNWKKLRSIWNLREALGEGNDVHIVVGVIVRKLQVWRGSSQHVMSEKKINTSLLCKIFLFLINHVLKMFSKNSLNLGLYY